MLPLFLRRRPHHLLHRYVTARTLVDLSAVKPVRDRALDHAVEKEQDLIPLLSLTHLLKSSPSNSLPLSLIKSSPSISLPTRPIDFIRRYPAVFQEHLPGGISIVDPHIKLTPQVLTLDDEEQSVVNSEINLVESADRLLKLLMIAGSRKIPLPVIERLRFDLGLPHDFEGTLIPNFPDYFQINHDELELVCWNGDLAVSVIEKKAKNYEKGMPLEFPMKFSTGFEMEKKFKKWVDEWQKLPFISPYENAMHLSAKSDEGDKWVVSVLHEVMSLLYSKKTDRENLLFFGECLGLRTRIKQALLHHPGIFYISRKLGSHTVVLRDGYKRDLLVEKHPLMGIRYKYIHLMHTVVEDKKEKVDLGKEKKQVLDTKEGEKKVNGEVDEVSGSEVDDENEDNYDDEDEDEDEDENEENEDENRGLSHPNGHGNRRRTRENSRVDEKRALRSPRENNLDGNRRKKRNYEDHDDGDTVDRRFSHENSRGDRSRIRENMRFEEKRAEFGRDRSNQRRSRNHEENNDDKSRKFSNNDSRGNRGRTKENPRFERKRDYDAKDDGEGQRYSQMNRGNRDRARDNSRFEGKRDFKSSDESGRDGSYQRRSRNYEENSDNNNSRGYRGRTKENPRFDRKRDYDDAKDEDDGQRYSQMNRGSRGRTRDNSRFEGKRDFKNSDESSRDGSYQRRTRSYEDSKREGFNGKSNDRGSKDSRYKQSTRSGMKSSV